MPNTSSQPKKLKSPRLRFGETVDARAYTIEDPANRYEENFMTEVNEEPAQDWQRRWNIGVILRHNARHQDNQTLLPLWITESPDNYATLKRPLPESKTDRIYIYDTDYRCDPWDEPTINDTNKLSFKIQVPNPQKQLEEVPKFSPPLSPILEKSEPAPTVPVTVMPTPINADDIFCIQDKTLWSRKSREQTIDSSSPPPPQIAPATAVTFNNEEKTECPPSLPEDLNVIKEIIQHDKDDDYFPLTSNNRDHSTPSTVR